MEANKSTILLLDDERSFAEMLEEALAGEGYRTQWFELKSDGLQWLLEHPVDLVITDIKAPGMSGLEFLARLRLSPQTRDTRTIVVSSNNSARIAKTVMRLGALAVFNKPIDFPDVMSSVNRLIREDYTFDVNPAKTAERGGVIIPGRETDWISAIEERMSLIESPRTRPAERTERTGFIAVLDDCPGYRELYSTLLQKEGYDVVAHEDKKAFLDLVPVFDPSLIITDILCPGMDGVGFIKQLKSREKYRRIPVIVVTAYVHEGHPSVQASLSAGAYACIDKPIIPGELITMVRKALAHSR